MKRKNIPAICVCFLYFILLIVGCKAKKDDKSSYIVQADIRFGNKFYSIYLNELGNAYVIKGDGTNYSEPLKIESSDTSRIFKLDSAKRFFEILSEVKFNPIKNVSRIGTAQRGEVYYNHQKIYDSYAWDESFWNLFGPIMEQIPKGFNPFLIDSKTFD